MNYTVIAFWSQIAAFIIFVAGTIYVWRKAIAPAVVAAQQASNERIAIAERHCAEMKEALEALRGEAEGARRDAVLIKERAGEQAEHERAAIVAEAREAGERALRGAGGELERARLAARTTLRVELLDRALDLARVTATNRMDDATNARLIDRFVGSLEGDSAKVAR